MHQVKSLYLSYDGLTDALGQSQVLPYLCGLSAKGYLITVISFEKRHAYLINKRYAEQLCAANNIQWKPLRYHKWPPILSTLFDFYALKGAVEKLLRSDNHQIIHCRSYLTSIIGLYAKQKWGTKFIFDMRGFWADERVEGGLWNLSNVIYKMIYAYFKRKEIILVQEADYIISLTNNAKEEIESWGVKTAPIKVIPTCVDLQYFNPMAISDELKRKKRMELSVDPTDFLLVYAGSWGTWYLTKEIIRFFEILKKENDQSRFLIITPDEVPNLDTGSIVILKAQRNEMPLLLSCANGFVFFIKPSFSKKASSATKLGEAMAMNVPVVTNAGWGDIEQYASASVNVLQNTSDEQMQNGARELLKKKITSVKSQLESLSLSNGVTLYDEVYQNLQR